MTSNEQILSSLLSITESFEKNTKKYLSSFDMGTSFSFSDNEDLKKKHLRTYNKFCVILKKHIEKYEKEIALISEHICRADNACDKNITESLVQSFDKYTVFATAVSHFIEKCDMAFLDKESYFKPMLIANYTRELLAAIQNYKENN